MVDSINQFLPITSAGRYDTLDVGGGLDVGGKAAIIRGWMKFLLRKIIRYKVAHRRLLEEAATILELELALPNDTVMNNVLPFLDLPLHRFDGEENESIGDNGSNGDTFSSSEENGNEETEHEDEDGEGEDDYCNNDESSSRTAVNHEEEEEQDNEEGRKRRKMNI